MSVHSLVLLASKRSLTLPCKFLGFCAQNWETESNELGKNQDGESASKIDKTYLEGTKDEMETKEGGEKEVLAGTQSDCEQLLVGK